MKTKYSITVECNNEEVAKRVTVQLKKAIIKLCNNTVFLGAIDIRKIEKGFIMDLDEKAIKYFSIEIKPEENDLTYQFDITIEFINSEDAIKDIDNTFTNYKMFDESFKNYLKEYKINNLSIHIPISASQYPYFTLKMDK